MKKTEQGNENRQPSPKQLDRVMMAVEIKAWIALAAVLLVFGGALIWSLFGTMQVREEVSGILVRSGRIINLYTTEERTVLDISIKAGDYVKSNQVIARMEQTQLVQEINKMLDEGYPQAEIDAARARLLESSQIITYDSGTVQDVFAHNGDYLPKGTRIATISKEVPGNQTLECILYVPIDQVKSLKKGMHVNISPDFASADEYGTMIGTVGWVDEYPVTYQQAYDRVGNEELAKALIGDKACFEVGVTLATSEDNTTGYKWTISMGPAANIGNLSLCDASILVDELRPLDVFFLRD